MNYIEANLFMPVKFCEISKNYIYAGWDITQKYGIVPKEGDLMNLTYKLLKKKENPVLLDCGSGIGDFCYIALLIDDMTCYSIDGHPQHIKILKYNLELNNLQDRVYTTNAIISDKVGNVDFYISNNMNRTGQSTYGRTDILIRDGVGTYKINVPSITIDKFIEDNKIKKVDLIKLDIEGAELMAIKGAMKTIKEYHPPLLVETEDGNTNLFDYKSKDIIDLLESIGYQHISIYSAAHNTYFWYHEEDKVDVD